MRYLMVIDMQNDFVTGPLGTDEARETVTPLIDFVRRFDGMVLLTQDTHFKLKYLDTEQGRNLPVRHCVKGTAGWELVDGLKELADERDFITFEKRTFGSVDLAEYLQMRDKAYPIDGIYLAGVCTDICVVTNALLVKSFVPDVPIYVISDLTAATSPEMKSHALGVMRSCHVHVVTSDEVISGDDWSFVTYDEAHPSNVCKVPISHDSFESIRRNILVGAVKPGRTYSLVTRKVDVPEDLSWLGHFVVTDADDPDRMAPEILSKETIVHFGDNVEVLYSFMGRQMSPTPLSSVSSRN